MDYLQYLIYFGVFMAGIFSHEGAHALFASFYKLNPEIDLWGLKVLYDQTDNDRAIRLIGLAPLLLGAFVSLTEVIYIIMSGGSIRMFTVLFLIGLLIGTSASDLSVQITKNGEWKAWKSIPAYYRVFAGGLVLYFIPAVLPKLFESTMALFILISALETASVVVMFLGGVMWILTLDKSKSMESEGDASELYKYPFE